MLIKIQFPNLGVCAHMPNNIIPFFFFFFGLLTSRAMMVAPSLFWNSRLESPCTYIVQCDSPNNLRNYIGQVFIFHILM